MEPFPVDASNADSWICPSGFRKKKVWLYRGSTAYFFQGFGTSETCGRAQIDIDIDIFLFGVVYNI